MLFSTSEWMRSIKDITIELTKLKKQKRCILKANAKYSEFLGIDSRTSDFEQLEEQELLENAFVLGAEGSKHRSSELETINRRIESLQTKLLAIKCVALSKATKLSSGAKKKGFLNNAAYRDALLTEKGLTQDELLSILEMPDDVWSLDMVDMPSRDANRISNRR